MLCICVMVVSGRGGGGGGVRKGASCQKTGIHGSLTLRGVSTIRNETGAAGRSLECSLGEVSQSGWMVELLEAVVVSPPPSCVAGGQNRPPSAHLLLAVKLAASSAGSGSRFFRPVGESTLPVLRELEGRGEGRGKARGWSSWWRG